MKEIKTVNGLLSVHDELDGKKLVDGEKLRVRFPDGSEEILTVIVKPHYFDHGVGHRLSVVRHWSYFQLSVRGIIKWITTYGLEAERV